MIDLRLFMAVYLVFYVIGLAAGVAQVGRPRSTITPAVAGCSLLIQIPLFIGLLLVWQQL